MTTLEMLRLDGHSQNLIVFRVDKPLKQHQVVTVGNYRFISQDSLSQLLKRRVIIIRQPD